MNATARPPAACSHPKLKAVNYDEDYRWVIRCTSCGHETKMSQKEWRQRLVEQEGVDLGIQDAIDTGDSTRLPPIPGSSRLPEL